jgi:hypothetical protein
MCRRSRSTWVAAGIWTVDRYYECYAKILSGRGGVTSYSCMAGEFEFADGRVSNPVRTEWPRRPRPACLVDTVALAMPLQVGQNAVVPAGLSRRPIHDTRS